MKRAILLVALMAVGGVVQAQMSGSMFQVSPLHGPRQPYLARADHFYSGVNLGSVQIIPRMAQPIDWMRGIPRNDVWDYNIQNGPTAWISSGPPRHRAATYAHFPNFPNVSPSRAVVDPLPADQVTAPPAKPYHDPFFEEHFWEDLEEDRDISDLWGW